MLRKACNEARHVGGGGGMAPAPLEERIGAVEIDAVEALRHDAVEMALGLAVDEPLPVALPELDREISLPPAVVPVEPGGLSGRVVPLFLPVGPVALGFADGKVSEQYARATVGARAHARPLRGQELALEAVSVGDLAVDHHEVVGCGGNARDVEGG